MHVIIAGGGSVGVELLKRLIEKKHRVVLIDNNKERCDEIYAAYGIETILGNATKIRIMKAAGIENADAVVGAMYSDADNLAFSVLAKSFSVETVIVRMRNKSYYEAYTIAGVTKVLNIVDRLVADAIYEIEKPEIQRITCLGDGAVELFIVHIPTGAKIIGKTVSEIANSKRLPSESILAGIYNNDNNEFKLPHGRTKINENDDIFIITAPEHVVKTTKYLTKT